MNITQLIKSAPHRLEILLKSRSRSDLVHASQSEWLCGFMPNFYPSRVPHIAGHNTVTIMPLKAGAFKACYRTCQCLPSCSSGLFNPQVRLETLLDFQSKVSKRGLFLYPCCRVCPIFIQSPLLPQSGWQRALSNPF